MDLLAYRNKFKLLFEQLAKPGYVLDAHYSDKLLIQLQATDDPEISKLLGTPFFSDQLLESLLHVEGASVPVRTFFLRLIAAVATNELQFSKLIRYPGFALLNKVTNISQTEVPPSIRVAYIEMATALTAHSSGVTWLLETQAWKHIFNLCYQSQTVHVLRAAYKFTGNFLWRLNDYADEDNLISILEYILKPIVDSPYHQIQTISEEEEASLVTPLQPSLHMLMAVLKDTERICKPNILVKLLTKHFVIKYNLIIIHHITRNEEVMLLISKIVFLLVLSTAVQNLAPENSNNCTALLDLSICFFNTVHIFIQRRLVTVLLDYCVTCNLYWAQVLHTNPQPMLLGHGKTFDVQAQIIIIPLMPILCYIKKNVMNVCKVVMDDFINKLVNVSCEHTTRAAYAMRDLVFENDCQAVAMQAIKRLFLLRNHLETAQANTIFQALFHVMGDFVPVDDAGDLILCNPSEDTESKLPIMSLVIDGIIMLLKGHNINWHESLETICLYNKTCNILKLQNLPTKFVVQVLSLVTLTVKKFLPPNLALLLESRDGSSLHEIGDLIYSKMHDLSWEVRDSAMELLQECTEIAFIKYTPFQKLILANGLISTAATIATSDSEFYVQASALKCLAAAAKIQVIWDDLLTKIPDLYVRLRSLFTDNPEGVVRKEAINVMCEVVQNQKVNDNFKNCMCKCMVLAALEDLHWEVQIAALKYWRSVVCCQLAYQGMIDGKFPTVTFSKDKRKIVNLTEREIQKNLVVVLENLASNGCLKALLHTLDDDVDVEVMETSLSISQDFIKILSQYNVSSVVTPEDSSRNGIGPVTKIEFPADISEMNGIEETSPIKSDMVISGIVKSDDLHLLANIYETQLKIKSEVVKEEPVLDPYPPQVPNIRVDPYTYLDAFRKKDFRSAIEEKRKWNAGIRSLHSVLDDALGLYENSDVNSLDCY